MQRPAAPAHGVPDNRKGLAAIWRSRRRETHRAHPEIAALAGERHRAGIEQLHLPGIEIHRRDQPFDRARADVAGAGFVEADDTRETPPRLARRNNAGREWRAENAVEDGITAL